MNFALQHRKVRVALLVLGSAILLLSCKGNGAMPDSDAYERLMTHKTDSLTIMESANGKVKYRFKAPIMERYEYARQPYMEFREGIDIITYNDSTMAVESTLKADYALYLEKQDLWEAKGNVVATNVKGEMLETQQLFWNRKTRLVYSNIDSKITQSSGVTYSEGFESDEEFKNWRIRRLKGTMAFEEPNRNRHDDGNADLSGAASAASVGESQGVRSEKAHETQAATMASGNAHADGAQSAGTVKEPEK